MKKTCSTVWLLRKCDKRLGRLLSTQLAERNEYQPESRSAIQQVGGSPSGRNFLVLYRNGNFWMLSMDDEQQMRKAKVIGQGEVNTFAFGENDQLGVR